MIDAKLLRSDIDVLRGALGKRNSAVDLDGIQTLEAKRREMLHDLEGLRAEQNKASQEIAKLKKAKEDASEAIAAMGDVRDRIKAGEEGLRALDGEFQAAMLVLPNLPHESVPIGQNEEDNRLERTHGEKPQFDFEVKDHVDLGTNLGGLDFERAAKLAGARFTVVRGAVARLERALIQFMLDVQTQEHGYTEVITPFMVNSESLQGTGQLPKFADDLFHLEGEKDLWLIPTAEVPLTNLHRDEILKGDDLPTCYVAYTPCFRSEAGSYGKDTRGMLRQHQFNKVELVKFTTPEDSWDELEKLTANAESILQRLGLHYRVVTLCTGDLGFSAAKTYDIEVWLPGQDNYREISSCSNCTDFQARRAGIRFKRGKKPELCHTLNGSGLAVGRTVIAVLENYQQADGSVRVPEVLQPYMNGLETITG
jgi:seryl-tRNA synthetase